MSDMCSLFNRQAEHFVADNHSHFDEQQTPHSQRLPLWVLPASLALVKKTTKIDLPLQRIDVDHDQTQRKWRRLVWLSEPEGESMS
jgi:hypothetical protein